MRSLLMSLVVGAATLGVWGFAPAQAQAQRWWGWRGWGYAPTYSSYYYYPGYSYYTPAYSYYTPAYTSYYYPSYPVYRSYYYAPPVTYVPGYSYYYPRYSYYVYP